MGGGCGPGPRRYPSSCVVTSFSWCLCCVGSSSCPRCCVVVARTSFVVGMSRCGHGGCGVVWLLCSGMVVVFMG